MNSLKVASLVLILFLGGCVNAIRVYEDGSEGHEPKKIDGLPFYAKTAEYKQDTVYEKYYYEVSLIKKTMLKTVIQKEEICGPIPIGKPGKDKLNELKKMIIGINSKGNTVDVNKIISKFWELQILNVDDNKDFEGYFEEITANKIEQIVIVDYDRKLYLNAPLPWFGSAKVSGEFNADGTLSKASSEVSTGLAEALSKLLPVKEALQATLVPEVREGKEVPEIQLTLVIEKRGNVYDFTAIHRNDPRTHNESCPSQAACKLKPIPFDLANGNYAMMRIEAAKAEKPDDNKIKFSGDITLPKQSEKK
jgi:hypothetical protein